MLVLGRLRKAASSAAAADGAVAPAMAIAAIGLTNSKRIAPFNSQGISFTFRKQRLLSIRPSTRPRPLISTRHVGSRRQRRQGRLLL